MNYNIIDIIGRKETNVSKNVMLKSFLQTV